MSFQEIREENIIMWNYYSEPQLEPLNPKPQKKNKFNIAPSIQTN